MLKAVSSLPWAAAEVPSHPAAQAHTSGRRSHPPSAILVAACMIKGSVDRQPSARRSAVWSLRGYSTRSRGWRGSTCEVSCVSSAEGREACTCPSVTACANGEAPAARLKQPWPLVADARGSYPQLSIPHQAVRRAGQTGTEIQSQLQREALPVVPVGVHTAAREHTSAQSKTSPRVRWRLCRSRNVARFAGSAPIHPITRGTMRHALSYPPPPALLKTLGEYLSL